MRRRRDFGLLALALTLGAACAPAVPQVDVAQGQIRADLSDFSVTLTSGEVRAGQVTFVVRNVGSSAHNFVVIRTDAAPDKLAIDPRTQAASEDGRVGALEEPFAPGQTLNLRLDLGPGRYVLICNVPGHYQLGMRAGLTVT